MSEQEARSIAQRIVAASARFFYSIETSTPGTHKFSGVDDGLPRSAQHDLSFHTSPDPTAADSLVAHAELKQGPSEKNSGDLVARGCLPFFVVAQSMDDGPYFWRQRSTTAANGDDVPEPPQRRTLRVARQDIDVLACGEVFNHRFRDELGPWRDRIVVAPSHTARGARFFRAREWAAGAGVRAMLRAVHAWSPRTQTGADSVGSIDATTICRWQ